MTQNVVRLAVFLEKATTIDIFYPFSSSSLVLSTPNQKTVNAITESAAEESRRKSLRASLLSSRSKGYHVIELFIEHSSVTYCLKNCITDNALDVRTKLFCINLNT